MQHNIWVIDDDKSIRFVLEKSLLRAGYSVTVFEHADRALNALKKEQVSDHPSVIVSDVRMPGTNGMDLLDTLQKEYAHIPVIIITAHSDLDSAVSAYEGGAFEYLPKPFDIDEAVDLVKRACEFSEQDKQKNVQSASDGESNKLSSTIIGEAPAMQEVFRAIGRLSRSNITVLINGESGTGKELVAHALHKHSPRAKQPFVALNMAAIPKDLLEAELFGHEKGAFTGASALRKGRFEQANGGTLFLDEIGDMPAELQTRLLRVLSDGEFYRIGGTQSVKVDVRIVAATHQHLEKLVEQGAFREDLFHRLNVIRIHLPALRERNEDVPLLMDYFLDRASKELHSEKKSLSPEVKEWLKHQPWPGNVRQLENVCRWLTVMAASHEVHMADLPEELTQADSPQAVEPKDSWHEQLRAWAEVHLKTSATPLLDVAVPDFERVMIQSALKHTNGRKQEAAKLLGWGRNTLTRKCKELDL